MDLRAYINGKEYDIVQGATFGEEYNETLDSGTIIIDNVEQMEDLNPYDDVFIYDTDSESFNGYTSAGKQYMSIDCKTDVEQKRLYFKKEDLWEIEERCYGMPAKELQHIELYSKYKSNPYDDAIDQLGSYFSTSGDDYQISLIIAPLGYVNFILKEDATEPNYYYIDYSEYLYSLYAGSLIFQVPTKSVVKPAFYKHLLVYQFTEERLNPIENLYKYKIELCSETKRLEKIQLPNISITQPLNNEAKRSVWDYASQYVNLYNVQFKVATSSSGWMYCYKYSLDPNLEEEFSKIYCPDLSLDNPSLKDVLQQLFLTRAKIPYVKDDVIYALDISITHGTFSTDGVYSIYGSKTLENYDTSLKRTYSNALSGTNTAKRVEYLGFRNSENALMTLGNMRIETKYPIYKINKIYMCYYKKATIYKIVDGVQVNTRDMVFLCKQDITDLVKLEEERQVLSEDWSEFNENKPSGANCVEEMAKYKLCTVGYSIGGNTISGWGTTYKYPKYWWDVSKTYIENIFGIIDTNIPYGIYTYGYISKSLEAGEFISTVVPSNPLDNLITPFTGASRLKSFFFEVDYEAFFNGTIITSKDINKDDITSNDNSSSSLTLLEKDGLFQKEKANRFGNMGYSIRANYNSISELQELGTIYDDNVIIYSREYQIWNNLVKASYQGTKDYVLKNYYTSVYSKIRPFALMDYSQSITRAENRKTYILLSKKSLYFEMPAVSKNFNIGKSFTVDQEYPINFSGFSDGTHIDEIVSFAEPSEKIKSIDKYEFNDKINYGYITYNDKKYSCDVNTFVSGYSLCFNISMTDNISMGNYIRVPSPEMNSAITSTDDDYTGSVQDFYSVVDSTTTGFTRTMGFYVSHVPQSEDFGDQVVERYDDIAKDLYENIFALPLLNGDLKNESNIIGKEIEICKDNKEVIDMTYQIEVYTNDSDVFFSEWLLKLSDLNGVYNKVAEDYTVKDVGGYSQSVSMYYSTAQAHNTNEYMPVIILKIPTSLLSKLSSGQAVSSTYNWDNKEYQDFFSKNTIAYDLTFSEFTSVSSSKIGLKAYYVKKVKNGAWGSTKKYAGTQEFFLTRTRSLGDLDLSGDYYYFTNINWQGSSVGYMPNTGSNFESLNCRDKNKVLYNANIDWTYFTDNELLISDLEGTSKTYYHNMYVRTDMDEIKKSLVYETKSVIDRYSSHPINEIITTETYINESTPSKNNPLYLRIRLKTLKTHGGNSVQVWYLDNHGFHFVLGANLKNTDWRRGYIDIYLSQISRKDLRVYNYNHLPVGEVANFLDEENDFVYGTRQYYVLK